MGDYGLFHSQHSGNVLEKKEKKRTNDAEPEAALAGLLLTLLLLVHMHALNYKHMRQLNNNDKIQASSTCRRVIFIYRGFPLLFKCKNGFK